jgi:hypothetical protein
MKTNYIFDYTSLKSSQDEKFFRQKLKKIKTLISCSITFFENRAVYGEILYSRAGHR